MQNKLTEMEEYKLLKDFTPHPTREEKYYYKNYPALFKILKNLEDEISLHKWQQELKMPLMNLKASIRQLMK